MEEFIRSYLEKLREKHTDVEFDYFIDLETSNFDQTVYTVSHSNVMQPKTIVWRYKIVGDSIGLFCAIPGVATSYWAHKTKKSLFSLLNALDEIYGSKLLKGMRGE